jgi:pSer/pThr/pTyr-binding forkhead associated (FHA) protein
MDPTSVGHYGTLVFLSAKDPEKIVTAYPVDSQTVTIGRDPSCDIRLYYADVSATHCKLVFSDRKV